MTKNSKMKTPSPVQNNLLGMLYMSIHVLALAVLYAVIKSLSKDLDSNLIAFIYKFSILIIVIPWCLAGKLEDMKTKRIGMHFSRGMLSILGSLCMFYAIKHISLSDITAVQYLEHVLMLVIGIIYFKEKASFVKLGAILVSFLGALIIVRPDLFQASSLVPANAITFNKYYIFVFMAIGFWAANSTVIKILGRTEKTKVQLFYTTLFSCILAIPFAFMKWQHVGQIGMFEIRVPLEFISFQDLNLKAEHTERLLLLATCYLIHSITHFKAFKHGEISAIIPFEYSRLIYAGIFGYLFFDEQPSELKYIGYALIIIAGLSLLYVEQKRSKRQKELDKKVLKDEFDQ